MTRGGGYLRGRITILWWVCVRGVRDYEVKGGMARRDAGSIWRATTKAARDQDDRVSCKWKGTLSLRAMRSGASPPRSRLRSSLSSNPELRDEQRSRFPRTENEASLCRNGWAMMTAITVQSLRPTKNRVPLHLQRRGAAHVL